MTKVEQEKRALTMEELIAKQRKVRKWVEQLVQPFEVRSSTQVDYRDGQMAVERRHHAVFLPCLIDQVRAAADGSKGAAGSTGGFDSRPPGPTDAIDVEIRIEVEAATFVRTRLHAQRSGLKRDLELIARRVPTLEDDDLEHLEPLARSWYVSASIVGGLEAPAIAPHIRCPLCEHQDTIRVRDLDPVTETGIGWCKDCGTAWDQASFASLVRLIREAAEQPDPEPEEEHHGD